MAWEYSVVELSLRSVHVPTNLFLEQLILVLVASNFLRVVVVALVLSLILLPYSAVPNKRSTRND